jgi:hypothetical protein
MCRREELEVEWAYQKIEEKIKIVRLGRLKKYLGIMCDRKQEDAGNTYLEAYIP